mgnify:CR=1 FL=1
MQIHRNHMVRAGDGDHVGDQLGADRRAALVLLVVPGVGERRDHSGDAARRRRLARREDDQQLHQGVVHIQVWRVPCLDHKHVLVAHRGADAHVNGLVRELFAHAGRQLQTQPDPVSHSTAPHTSTHLVATSRASSGWLFPVSSLMLFAHAILAKNGGPLPRRPHWPREKSRATWCPRGLALLRTPPTCSSAPWRRHERQCLPRALRGAGPVSYTHLRAHET